MAIEWLTSTKKGHGTGATFSLRRLFDFALGKHRCADDGDFHGSIRSQLSNAEYHLTARQMARVIEAGRSFRDRALLRTLAETGMRRAEVASLNVEDIQWKERLLVVRRGKRKKLRLIPMTEILAIDLKELAGIRTVGPVFESRNHQGLSLRQINRIVADAGKRAGVRNPNPKYKNITPHLFRHSFARLWKGKRGSIETLSKILGHQSQATTWDFYGSEGLQDIQRNYSKIMGEKNRKG